ncbi:microsomal signal peptidase 12 kDa subunit-domain-containing protein, partial [Jimgerdemannia flammicorona]
FGRDPIHFISDDVIGFTSKPHVLKFTYATSLGILVPLTFHNPTIDMSSASSIADWFEWRIDFEGQKLSENLTQAILIGFAVRMERRFGYLQQSLKLTLIFYLVGLVISLIVTIPSWSVYNKNPIKWLTKSSTVPAAEKGEAMVVEKDKRETMVVQQEEAVVHEEEYVLEAEEVEEPRAEEEQGPVGGYLVEEVELEFDD